MRCFVCGANMVEGFTTDVTELGECVIIIRNVPCWKCTRCAEIFYNSDVVKKLEEITNKAKASISEITLIDYKKAA